LTFETKHLISVSDVLGLEFECNHCKAKISLPVEATRAVWQCPVCNADWIISGTDEQNAIQSLLKVFRNAERALQGRPFSLKLQVTAPPKP
jgi:ribosomal protein L37AE/L43A